MKFTCKTNKVFKKNFKKLTPSQRALAREKYKTFKKDPWDPTFRTHKINKLSAIMGTKIFSATVEADLKVLFKRGEGNEIISIDIGTHAVYQ